VSLGEWVTATRRNGASEVAVSTTTFVRRDMPFEQGGAGPTLHSVVMYSSRGGPQTRHFVSRESARSARGLVEGVPQPITRQGAQRGAPWHGAQEFSLRRLPDLGFAAGSRFSSFRPLAWVVDC